MVYSAYVYKLICIPLNLYYIGSRKNSNWENDFWVKYFTSSKVVKNLIAIYGRGISNWKFEIMSTHISHEDAIIAEDFLLRAIPKNQRKEYMNINFHTGGSLITNINLDIITDGIKTIRWPMNIPYPENFYKQYNTPPSQVGKRNWINPTTMVRKLTHSDLSSDGYVLLKEFTKNKNRRPKNLLRWYTDGHENRKYMTGEAPDGWELGMVTNNRKPYKKRETSSTKNKNLYINENGHKIFLKSDDEIPVGYVLSRFLNDFNRKN